MSELESGSVDVRLRVAVESSPSGLLMIDSSGAIVLVNREVERLFGYSREELLGRSIETLVPERFRMAHPDYRAGFLRDPSARAMGAGRELFALRKDGSEVPVEIGLNPIETEEGVFVLSSIVDISARRAAEQEHRLLEEQLRHVQKMEAVGRLAGGVAHDFNNILASILGYAELLQESVTQRGPAGDVEEILRAARRGKEIVERILRFGRRQEVEVRPVDVGHLLEGTVRLLRAMLPAAIAIESEWAGSPLRIVADATSVQQVLMNLATNAADAMPLGGRIEMTAEPFFARDSFVRSHPGLVEGAYVLVRVRDSGHGMDEETQARAMEPFFTTKEPGKGSGLGLSIVHGIVRDHGGTLWIESVRGVGTTVNLLIPAPDEEVEHEAEVEEGALPRGRGERLLLVDDEPSLAKLGKRRLTGLGYEVTATEDPLAALGLLLERPKAFRLLITDFSMPNLTGLELAARARAADPELSIMMLTGYTDAFSEVDATRLVDRIERKPIRARDLAVAVRALLDEGPRAEAGEHDEETDGPAG